MAELTRFPRRRSGWLNPRPREASRSGRPFLCRVWDEARQRRLTLIRATTEPGPESMAIPGPDSPGALRCS